MQTGPECKRCKEFHTLNPLPNDFIQTLGLPNKRDNKSDFFIPEKSKDLEDKNKTYMEQVEELKEKKIIADSDLGEVNRCKVKISQGKH